ncbi:unnamed protein product [Mytilus edulis]|uniref:Uncharacterized protein n=1 Tax=Mytilus edulis TaxID=6550 RepID=A0A8S3Q6Y1_MYTED|nr:unnamed protein product [Mytilus edulis]
MIARACLVQVDDQCHDEAKPAAMKRDGKHVQDLIVYITENMTNPFDVDNHPRQLINISTGLHASHDIEESLLKSVETGRTRMKIFVESSLSTDKAANILPAVHALTGCDTTSAIFGFGKKTVFKLIRKSPSKFTNLQNFDKIDFSTSLSAARELISSFYDPKDMKDKFASSHVDLNKLRVKLATCKDTSLLRLKPSKPALKEHVLRSCLQTNIWMSSHLDHPNPLFPYENGWKKSSHGPDPVYF